MLWSKLGLATVGAASLIAGVAGTLPASGQGAGQAGTGPGAPFTGDWRLIGNGHGEGGYRNLLYYDAAGAARQGDVARVRLLSVDAGVLGGVRSNLVDVAFDCVRPVFRQTGQRNFDAQHRPVAVARQPEGEQPVPSNTVFAQLRALACANRQAGEAVSGDVQRHADGLFAAQGARHANPAPTRPLPREATYRFPGDPPPGPGGERLGARCGFRAIPDVEMRSRVEGFRGSATFKRASIEGGDADLSISLRADGGGASWPDMRGAAIAFSTSRSDRRVRMGAVTVGVRTARVVHAELLLDGRAVSVPWQVGHRPARETGSTSDQFWQDQVLVMTQSGLPQPEVDRAVDQLTAQMLQARRAEVRLLDASRRVVERRTFSLEGLARLPDALRSTGWRCEP